MTTKNRTTPDETFRRRVRTVRQSHRGVRSMGTTEAGAAQEQLRIWYPQFSPAVPLRETAAVRAWLGRIQPLPDGTAYHDVMTHLERDETVRVEENGQLAHPRECPVAHNFHVPFGSSMTTSFEILLLEFPDSRHPRVYGVAPEISRRRFPYHPHFRDDQQIVFNGKPLPALCIYLSSDQVLTRDAMSLVHVLDYTAMFLAKHLVWAATYRVDAYSLLTNKITTIPNPGALPIGEGPNICDGTHPQFASAYRKDAAYETQEQMIERWFRTGHWQMPRALWVGSAAPHSIGEMLREFDARDECPCGSGLRYGECHRRQHQAALAS